MGSKNDVFRGPKMDQKMDQKKDRFWARPQPWVPHLGGGGPQMSPTPKGGVPPRGGGGGRKGQKMSKNVTI
jgi:hypothetical protein